MSEHHGNPFNVARDAIAHMSEPQLRLTLQSLIGRSILAGGEGWPDGTALHLITTAMWDDLSMWAEFNSRQES